MTVFSEVALKTLHRSAATPEPLIHNVDHTVAHQSKVYRSLFYRDNRYCTCAGPARRSQWAGTDLCPAASPPHFGPSRCRGWAGPNGDACSSAKRRSRKASLSPEWPSCHPAPHSHWVTGQLSLQEKRLGWRLPMWLLHNLVGKKR